jgi:hypothetical protein
MGCVKCVRATKISNVDHNIQLDPPNNIYASRKIKMIYNFERRVYIVNKENIVRVKSIGPQICHVMANIVTSLRNADVSQLVNYIFRTFFRNFGITSNMPAWHARAPSPVSSTDP